MKVLQMQAILSSMVEILRKNETLSIEATQFKKMFDTTTTKLEAQLRMMKWEVSRHLNIIKHRQCEMLTFETQNHQDEIEKILEEARATPTAKTEAESTEKVRIIVFYYTFPAPNFSLLSFTACT